MQRDRILTWRASRDDEDLICAGAKIAGISLSAAMRKGANQWARIAIHGPNSSADQLRDDEG